jgi:prevent-host-death family protein
MVFVPATDLKHHLGRHLRRVRAGAEIVVTDRDEPVARLVPFHATSSRAIEIAVPSAPDSPALGDIEVRGLVLPAFDSVAALRSDRDRR